MRRILNGKVGPESLPPGEQPVGLSVCGAGDSLHPRSIVTVTQCHPLSQLLYLQFTLRPLVDHPPPQINIFDMLLAPDYSLREKNEWNPANLVILPVTAEVPK